MWTPLQHKRLCMYGDSSTLYWTFDWRTTSSNSWGGPSDKEKAVGTVTRRSHKRVKAEAEITPRRDAKQENQGEKRTVTASKPARQEKAGKPHTTKPNLTKREGVGLVINIGWADCRRGEAAVCTGELRRLTRWVCPAGKVRKGSMENYWELEDGTGTNGIQNKFTQNTNNMLLLLLYL